MLSCYLETYYFTTIVESTTQEDILSFAASHGSVAKQQDQPLQGL